VTTPFLTVLTAPVPSDLRRAYGSLRRAVRPLVKPGAPLPIPSPYPGHHAVVRSVVEGLRAIGADFNFNPRSLRAVARVVYAPANEALRQATLLKRRGRIDYLAAGPVNTFWPDEVDGVLRQPEIDRLIVPSEWVRELYRAHAPGLVDKVRVCPAGVDPDYWCPSPGRPPSGRAIVYWKSGPEAFCGSVETAVNACGLRPHRVRYGAYEREEYRRLLAVADVAVFVSHFETQGLALAEAWAMDVPTVVWDPRGPAEWAGRSFIAGSSCPFLTPETGRAWRTLAELPEALRQARADRAVLAPRRWVLSHMTDAICADQLHRMIRADVAGRRAAVG
jgi:glycosyltransferase involved in cell wall biosynthesis